MRPTKRTRTHDYLLYRMGSNTANQPCENDWVPIAIVRAASREEAEATTWGDRNVSAHQCPTVAAEVLVRCSDLNVWANQRLKAVPYSRAPWGDCNTVLEGDLARASN